MKKYVYSLLAFLFTIIPHVQGQGNYWKEYVNEHFGFALVYPGALVAKPWPKNELGRDFLTPNGEFTIAATGGFLRKNSRNDTFEGRWQEELRERGDSITYKKKGNSWYVVSGIHEDGTEYYYKFYSRGDRWAAFEIHYPHARNRKYDPWVSQIEDRFVPFLP